MTSRAIFLAAGQGTRLRPITDDRPKCMVELAGQPLLYWQLQATHAAGVQDNVVVVGYCKQSVKTPTLNTSIKFVDNPKYDTTNMVRSLWCAEEYFGEGFLLSYTDIVYEPEVVKRLMDSPFDVSVVVDLDWYPYWAQRFQDPLSDAESLKMSADGRITDIGQKEKDLNDIQAQYIGLLHFKKKGVEALRKIYGLESDAYAKGKSHLTPLRNLDKLYITDVLQGLIQAGVSVHAVPIRGQWLEVDSLSDLELAKRFAKPLQDGKALKIDRTRAGT